MKYKKEISSFRDIEEIIVGEGSHSSGKIKVKCNSKFPIENSRFKSSRKFKKEEHLEAVEYIKGFVDAGNHYYENKSFISGEHIRRGNYIQKHKVEFYQEIAEQGIGKKNRLRVLEGKIRFRIN